MRSFLLPPNHKSSAGRVPSRTPIQTARESNALLSAAWQPHDGRIPPPASHSPRAILISGGVLRLRGGPRAAIASAAEDDDCDS